jgi:hypothetical protein
MNQQEGFEMYLKHIHDTSQSLIQLWDTRDIHIQMKYGPLIKQLIDIEKIIALVKAEMVADASNLG